MKALKYSQKLYNIIASATLAVVLFLSLFGLNLSIKLMSSGEMMDCQFMQETASMCPMNIIDHINAWQNSLTGIITEILTVGIVIFAIARLLETSRLTIRPEFSLYYYYKKKNFLLNSLLPWRLAFARGLINPKIY